MAHINHACLVSLVAYGGTCVKEDNVADQPVFIQELSSTLENAFNTCVNRLKPRNTYCHLCQIAHNINKVTERAQYLQINASPSRNMPGAFTSSTDKLYEELKEDCQRLIQTLQTIVGNDRNRSQNTPVGAASPTLDNACDVKNNIAGDSDVKTPHQDEGGHPLQFENPGPEDASGGPLPSLPKTEVHPSFTTVPSPLPANCPSHSPTLASLPATTPSFTFQSLAMALNKLSGQVTNEVTANPIGELLNLLEHNVTASESDVHLLIEILLHLLRNNTLVNSGVQDASRKARKLLSKLITMTDVIPRSLFITDVCTQIDVPPTATGGFGRVQQGKYAGQLVALKVLEKVRHEKSTLPKDLCTEALTWRSISHRFILPLLGIYEEKPSLFLVSPFMANGTLNQWRRKKGPDVVEIHRVMLEVAEAIQYLHSEGMVHGDLHGGNVLIDSEFHCQVTDFGLTRHSEATVAWTTKAVVANYAAPELFGMCSVCDQQECDGRHPGHRTTKTVETDVYAFGCLYYETFFDTPPYQGKYPYQIMGCVVRGKCPDRLENPIIDDKTWNLIKNCWMFKPLERPTMDKIVETMTLPA